MASFRVQKSLDIDIGPPILRLNLNVLTSIPTTITLEYTPHPGIISSSWIGLALNRVSFFVAGLK